MRAWVGAMGHGTELWTRSYGTEGQGWGGGQGDGKNRQILQVKEPVGFKR